jgi:hypothetical protein
MVKVDKLRKAREEELLSRKMEFVELHAKKIKRLAEERAAEESQTMSKVKLSIQFFAAPAFSFTTRADAALH